MLLLLGRKSDGIRSVHEWLGMVDAFLQVSPDIQRGGEFEMTEILELRENLAALIAILPKDSKWYSASWLHPNETREFYEKLKAFCTKYQLRFIFQRTLKYFNDRYLEDARFLEPRSILKWCKKNDGYGWELEEMDLPMNKSSRWELYVADHEKKESRKVGTYSVDKTGNWTWRLDENINLPEGSHVVFIKK